VNIEVLEGDGEQMRLVQLAQRLCGHVARTGVVYSAEVLFNVHSIIKALLDPLCFHLLAADANQHLADLPLIVSYELHFGADARYLEFR
jgi:hypothetical protein